MLDEKLNVFLIQPGEKERQIGVVESDKKEWHKEQPVKGLRGVHEVIVKNQEDKVVARTEVR